MEPDLRWNADQHERISRVHLVRARVSIGFLSVGGHVQRSPEWTRTFVPWPGAQGARYAVRGNQIGQRPYLISVSVPARSLRDIERLLGTKIAII